MQSKKTKIVCTMGPSTESEDVLRELIKAGMNVARLNMSHGSYPDHLKRLHLVREAADASYVRALKKAATTIARSMRGPRA